MIELAAAAGFPSILELGNNSDEYNDGDGVVPYLVLHPGNEDDLCALAGLGEGTKVRRQAQKLGFAAFHVLESGARVVRHSYCYGMAWVPRDDSLFWPTYFDYSEEN